MDDGKDFWIHVIGAFVMLAAMVIVFWFVGQSMGQINVDAVNEMANDLVQQVDEPKKTSSPAIPEGTFVLAKPMTQPLHSVRFDRSTKEYRIDYVDSHGHTRTVYLKNSRVHFMETTGSRCVKFHNHEATIYLHKGDKITEIVDSGSDNAGETSSSSSLSSPPITVPFPIVVPTPSGSTITTTLIPIG
jgi:hypothetical protein